MEFFYKSKFFSLEELTNTDFPYFNQPKTFEEMVNLMCLQVFLDYLRTWLERPIYVSSGYRCKEVNDACHGVKKSWHLKGLAADIYVKSCTPKKLKEIIEDNFVVDFAFEELIAHKEYLHLAIKRPYWMKILLSEASYDIANDKIK